MPASLKEADWKAMLNKPKNAGLKAGGGTGIGDKLRKVEETFKEYNRDRASVQAHNALVKAYDDLQKQCQAIVTKHGKLYTEACGYLKQVKELALREHEVRTNQTPEVAARYQVRNDLQRYWGDLINEKGNAELRKTLAKVLKVFEDKKGDWQACNTTATKLRIAMSKLDGIELGKNLRTHDVGKVFTEVIQRATKD